MKLRKRMVSNTSILQGHRDLLVTFEELADPVCCRDDVDVPHFRAVVSFLKESVLPFARQEELHDDTPAELAESTAFEHAFLAVETAKLSAAITDYEAGTGSTIEVHRHLLRIGAVLQLHVEKAEDHASHFRAAPTPSRPDLRLLPR